MRPTCSTGAFVWHEASFVCPSEPFSYHIDVEVDGRMAVVDRYGAAWADGVPRGRREDFRVFPGFHVPVWSKGALQYQIFCDRFCNGDVTNDVVEGEYTYHGTPVTGTLAWDAPIPLDDYRSFRGGDLAGIIEKLDYLGSLGVEVLYLNPIFVSPSSHKYDTQDYRAIDPHLGSIVRDTGVDTPGGRYRVRTTEAANLEASNALFARLCQELHARSMRVIIDGVDIAMNRFNTSRKREEKQEEKHDDD